MVQVFKRDLSIRHYAPFLSLANLFRICAYVAVAVLAFVFAYDSGDLWKKQGTYLEQPKVQLRTEAIMVLTTVATSTGVVSRRIWSTMSDLNNLIPSARLLAGTFRSSQTDSNRDGIVDYINVNVIVPVDTTFTVRGARLATFVNVVLQDKVKMQMNAIAIAEHESTLPGVMFSSAGPLLFQQRTPLITTTKITDYASDPTIPNAVSSYSNFDFDHWILSFTQRNETVAFSDPAPKWLLGTDNRFQVNVTMQVPTQTIQYVPAFSEVAKFAWIQVASIGALLYVLIVYWLGSYVYAGQVLQTEVRTDAGFIRKPNTF
ncbi:Transmembrane protein 231 [Plasmodiophora brassicae]|uniref:Transmembrane protein 231 n=1 Tax=Plasmodiophora brassicae TaxID=37360 RepID=A0A0G4IMX4_PLABS|nr:hypothetical protein PBRA_005189 [Plasmodiophora brassicae]